MIALQDVSKTYGQAQVLCHVSAVFAPGLIHGSVGQNGSGKTQLFKVICGYVTPDAGEVIVAGQRIGQDRPYPDQMGLMLETPGFLPQYSGYANLALLMGLSRKPDKARIRAALDAVGLLAHAAKRVGKYSMGMRQRLGIAQAIMEDPALMILDEPFNGLDKQGTRDIRTLLLQMKQAGKTILLASHNPQDIDVLCDTVHEMDAGSIRPVRAGPA